MQTIDVLISTCDIHILYETHVSYFYMPYYNLYYEEMRKKLGWLSMKQRRELHSLTMMYKILHGLAPNYLSDLFSYQNEIHNVNTRGSSDHQVWIDKSIKSKIHRDSFRYHTPCQYNKLPKYIRECKSVNSFKSNLAKFLKNN